MDRGAEIGDDGWFLRGSFVPFALALLRYRQLVLRGEAEAPEDAILGDPIIMVLGAVWLGCFVMAVHAL